MRVCISLRNCFVTHHQSSTLQIKKPRYMEMEIQIKGILQHFNLIFIYFIWDCFQCAIAYE